LSGNEFGSDITPEGLYDDDYDATSQKFFDEQSEHSYIDYEIKSHLDYNDQSEEDHGGFGVQSQPSFQNYGFKPKQSYDGNEYDTVNREEEIGQSDYVRTSQSDQSYSLHSDEGYGTQLSKDPHNTTDSMNLSYNMKEDEMYGVHAIDQGYEDPLKNDFSFQRFPRPAHLVFDSKELERSTQPFLSEVVSNKSGCEAMNEQRTEVIEPVNPSQFQDVAQPKSNVCPPVESSEVQARKKPSSSVDRAGISGHHDYDHCQSPSRRSPKSPPRSPSWMKFRESPPRSPPYRIESPPMSPLDRYPAGASAMRTSMRARAEEIYDFEGSQERRQQALLNYDNSAVTAGGINIPTPPSKPTRRADQPYEFASNLTEPSIHSFDLASFAATVASDTAHLTNLSVSPMNPPDKLSTSMTGNNPVAEKRLQDQQQTMVQYKQPLPQPLPQAQQPGVSPQQVQQQQDLSREAEFAIKGRQQQCYPSNEHKVLSSTEEDASRNIDTSMNKKYVKQPINDWVSDRSFTSLSHPVKNTQQDLYAIKGGAQSDQREYGVDYGETDGGGFAARRVLPIFPGTEVERPMEEEGQMYSSLKRAPRFEDISLISVAANINDELNSGRREVELKTSEWNNERQQQQQSSFYSPASSAVPALSTIPASNTVPTFSAVPASYTSPAPDIATAMSEHTTYTTYGKSLGNIVIDRSPNVQPGYMSAIQISNSSAPTVTTQAGLYSASTTQYSTHTNIIQPSGQVSSGVQTIPVKTSIVSSYRDLTSTDSPHGRHITISQVGGANVGHVGQYPMASSIGVQTAESVSSNELHERSRTVRMSDSVGSQTQSYEITPSAYVGSSTGYGMNVSMRDVGQSTHHEINEPSGNMGGLNTRYVTTEPRQDMGSRTLYSSHEPTRQDLGYSVRYSTTESRQDMGVGTQYSTHVQRHDNAISTRYGAGESKQDVGVNTRYGSSEPKLVTVCERAVNTDLSLNEINREDSTVTNRHIVATSTSSGREGLVELESSRVRRRLPLAYEAKLEARSRSGARGGGGDQSAVSSSSDRISGIGRRARDMEKGASDSDSSTAYAESSKVIYCILTSRSANPCLPSPLTVILLGGILCLYYTLCYPSVIYVSFHHHLGAYDTQISFFILRIVWSCFPQHLIKFRFFLN